MKTGMGAVAADAAQMRAWLGCPPDTRSVVNFVHVVAAIPWDGAAA